MNYLIDQRNNMNWGKGIILGMIIFMLFITGMCIYMFLAPMDDYDHQYYEKGLSFNHDYDREQQVVKDHAQPLIKVDSHYITFRFASPVKGDINFMRPSDTGLDKHYHIDSGNDLVVSLPREQIKTGEWQVIIEWGNNKKQYLYQQKVYIK